MRWVRYRMHSTSPHTVPHIRMTACGWIRLKNHEYGFLCISSSCRSMKSWKETSSLFVSPDTSHLVSVARGLHGFATLLFGVWKGWEDELICNDMLHYSFFASAIKLIVGFSLFKPSVATMHIHTNIQDTEDNECRLDSSQINQIERTGTNGSQIPPPVPSESELISFNLQINHSLQSEH